MPAHVIEDPLSVEFVFGDASRYTVKLADLPCAELVAELATGLAGLAHPHGGINSRATARGYRVAIRLLARFLDEADFVGGAAELTRGRLVEFWLGTRPANECATREVLRCVDAETGVLAPEVRAHLAGAKLRVVRYRDKKPFQPYSETEWERLGRCCREVTEAAFADQHAAIAQGRGGRHPRDGVGSVDNWLWLFLHRGPLGRGELAEELDRPAWQIAQLGQTRRAAERLFPSVRVALAYRLLLGMTTGIVPDGLDDVELDGIEWAGDTAVLLDYVKGRSGPESLVLPKPAVRVLRRWLEHSALLRQFTPAPDRARLWLAYAATRPQSLVPQFEDGTVRNWVRDHGIQGDDGEPLPIHRHRIRTTFQNRRDKRAWTGRTTIDPNHGARVEGDHYLSRPTQAQRDALESVIEDAQADLVRKATVPVVLRSDHTEAAAARLPARIAGLELTAPVIVELLGGQRDVFTAACADQLAGMHGPVGKPCPARPWVCLLCPLAVFAPRHAPNLLRLKAFFARQFRQLPTAQFIAVFGPYAQQLDQHILPRFAPAVLAAAAAAVEDRDGELPLRPEETTT